MDINACKQHVLKRIPEIPPETMARAMPVHSGWDSFVLDTGEWIFRFPRRPNVQAQLHKEARLLPALAAHLSTPIPQFRWVCLGEEQDEASIAFVGYTKLPGEPLDAQAAASPQVAQQLGHFLSELHSFPAARARQFGVPGGQNAWRQHLLDFYAWAQRETIPLLQPTLHQIMKDAWEKFLSRTEFFNFTPVLIHADLSVEHILWDGQGLSGVIDWGDSQLGDPALDFTGLHWLGGRRFVEHVLAGYTLPTPADLWHRIAFYTFLSPFHEIRYGLDTEQPTYIESGLAHLIATLADKHPLKESSIVD